MIEVSLRPHVGVKMTALGPGEVVHPIKQVFANGEGQDPVHVGYFFLESGHLAFINANLIESQKDEIRQEVERQLSMTAKNVTQAKQLVDAPDESDDADNGESDLEGAGL